MGYPKLLCGFDCTPEQFSTLLDRVTVAGGGDYNEGLLAALMLAYDSLDWKMGATKSVIVLTDAGYHSPDKSGVTYDEVVQRSLEVDPVNTYVISTSGETVMPMQQLAADTGGKVFAAADLTDGFLDEIAGYVVGRPVALLALWEYWAEVGSELRFDASMSYGVGGEIVSYDWDFDGDGTYEVVGGEEVAEWSYPGEFEGFAVVRAVDEDGRSGTMSAKVHVGGEAPVQEEPEIDGGLGSGEIELEESDLVDFGDEGALSLPNTGSPNRSSGGGGVSPAWLLGSLFLAVSVVGMVWSIIAKKKEKC